MGNKNMNKNYIIQDEERMVLLTFNKEKLIINLEDKQLGYYLDRRVQNSEYFAIQKKIEEKMVILINQNKHLIRQGSKEVVIQEILKNKKMRSYFQHIILKNGLTSLTRWSFWSQYMESSQRYSESKKIMLKKSVFQNIINSNSIDEDSITKDINRTFCKISFFQKKDDFGCVKLYEVCKGLSKGLPHIGYVQGMNFVAGFVLMVSGMDSFGSYNFILNFFKNKKNLYFGLYAKDFPVLQFMNFVVKEIMKISNQKLFKHFQSINFPIDIIVNKWFLVFFVNVLPIEYILRIFDFLILSDVFGMIVISIIIFNQLEKKLIKLNFEEIGEFFSNEQILGKYLSFKKFNEELKQVNITIEYKKDILNKYYFQSSLENQQRFKFYYDHYSWLLGRHSNNVENFQPKKSQEIKKSFYERIPFANKFINQLKKTL